jgi:hypothetical protein
MMPQLFCCVFPTDVATVRLDVSDIASSFGLKHDFTIDSYDANSFNFKQLGEPLG